MRITLLTFCLLTLAGCASLMSSATSGLAGNLGSAILNQDDPETVRDGAPAFLIMLDSFVEGSPEDVEMLSAASELYAAYGVLFVSEPDRALRLTQRSRSYAERALCASNKNACGSQALMQAGFDQTLEKLRTADTPALYVHSLSTFAWIKASGGAPTAMTRLPLAEAGLRRVAELDPGYNEAKVQHYLGVLSTIRPPMLGGDFDAGKQHYENAWELSGQKDLSILVDYANFYARTLCERELHDQLLNQVIAADPVHDGLTLFNVMAQREASELLASADDYF